MKFYEGFLTKNGKEVRYIEAKEELADVRVLIQALQREGISTINAIDPTDNYLGWRL